MAEAATTSPKVKSSKPSVGAFEMPKFEIPKFEIPKVEMPQRFVNLLSVAWRRPRTLTRR